MCHSCTYARHKTRRHSWDDPPHSWPPHRAPDWVPVVFVAVALLVLWLMRAPA